MSLELLQTPPLSTPEALKNTQPVMSVDMPNATAESLNGSARTLSFLDAVEGVGAKNQDLGIDQSLIGVLSIDPENAVGLIRITNGDKVVLGLSRLKKGTAESGDRATLIGIVDRGAKVTIGRDDLNPEDVEISRKHASISLDLDGNLVVEDTSTNGTDLVTFERPSDGSESVAPRGLSRFLRKKNQPQEPIKQVDISEFITDIDGWSVKSKTLADKLVVSKPKAEWDYTMIPEDIKKLRKELKGYEEPYVDDKGQEVPAKFQGRDVIKRDSRINGGVYIVPGIQEAIVVDDGRGNNQKGSEEMSVLQREYGRAYSDFLTKAKALGANVEHGVKADQETSVVRAAFASSVDILDYDLGIASSIASEHKDEKVNLSLFLQEGKGVCRHQALLASYYLERAISGGYMSGRVSVDRNYVEGRGGHAWARYTDSSGEVYIIDPAQNFVGTLKESKGRSDTWNYSRPEEV